MSVRSAGTRGWGAIFTHTAPRDDLSKASRTSRT